MVKKELLPHFGMYRSAARSAAHNASSLSSTAAKRCDEPGYPSMGGKLRGGTASEETLA